MADVVPTVERSKMMAKIRSTGNRSTELKLVQFFRSNGITGWQRGSNLTGRPDFIFQKERIAIFVDGCFWHACPNHASLPTNNELFWLHKLWTNQERDRLVARVLREKGWRVLRIWEHELEVTGSGRVIQRVKRALNASSNRSF